MGNSSSKRDKGRKCRSLPSSPRQIPVPYSKSSIPQPATVLVTRRCNPDKGRHLPLTPIHISSAIPNCLTRNSSGTTSNDSSNNSSPPETPKNGIRLQSECKIPKNAPKKITSSNGSLLTNGNIQQQQQQQQNNGATKNHSMLDKLKLFNKEKDTPKPKLSERTSSSSGFSSARSERSDSSMSLNNEHTNLPTDKIKMKPPKETLIAKSSMKVDKKCNEPKITDTPPTRIQKTVKMQQPSDSKLKQQHQQVSVGRKLEANSEMKTSLSSQLQQSKSTAVSTGIPKPTAAIQGIAKNNNNSVIDSATTVEQCVFLKIEPGNNLNSHSHNNNNCGMSENNNNISISLNHNSDGQIVNPSHVVTPLHNQLLNQNNTSTSIHSNNSSVQNRNQMSDRKMDNDPVLTNDTNGNKLTAIPNKVNRSVTNNQMVLGDDTQQGSPIHFGGYSHNNNGQGYCSDGDALKKVPLRYTEFESGYLSESYTSILKNRPQLPTTIEMEERSRSSREESLQNVYIESCVNKSQDKWSGMPIGNNQQVHQSPSSGRKSKNGSPSHSRRSNSSSKNSSPSKGVPQNFGYTRRSNESSAAIETHTSAMMAGGRTAHVSAVPRTNKLKVSGGTQTDFQQKMADSQNRSYSLTGPGAAQLSQSMKEKFAMGTHSLPKAGLDMQVFQQRTGNRGSTKLIDGSLSDSQSNTIGKQEFCSYAMWLNNKKSNNRLSEGDQLQNTQLDRNNSIRSTKSEKNYQLSILSRGSDIEIEPFYCIPVAQSSPARGFVVLQSPSHTNHRFTNPKKYDEAHGSQISLMSGVSSMYGSTTEEHRQANEVRRLKRELIDARDQAMSLSSQLSTNAHVVQAFEQSLGNMTSRLQHLTATTEKKESEITEMRQTIELLKKQSIQAGLTSAHIQSMGNGNKIPASPSKLKKQQQQQHQQQEEVNSHNDVENGNGLIRRQNSSESISSLNSAISNYSTYDKKKKKGWLRSSFTKAFSRNAKISKINRQMSLPSNHSDMKISLPPPTPQHQTNLDCGKPPTSPTKQPRFPPVFDNPKVTEKTDEHGHPIVDDLKKQLREKDLVLTDIRLESLTQASQMENLKETVRSMRHEMMTLKQNNERLQKMVTTRSLAGSDGSLGCPASPSGSMDSKRYSLVPESNMQRSPRDVQRDHDETDDDFPPAPAPLSAPLSPSIIADLLPAIDRISISNEILTMAAEDVADPIDGKKIEIAVYHGHSETFQEFSESFTDCDYINGNHENANFNSISETIIANTYISGKTTWQNLDYIVRKTFKDFVGRIDPGTNLGLNTDSIISYHLGEAKRGPEMTLPEFLPCGYIIGDIKKLYICLQGVGSLAFESLIPRSIVHRYINLLTEHRRLILCGPSGTGKSYLARKLAEFMVVRSNRSPADSIATFNVDQDSSKDLQQYLSHIVEQATLCQSSEELPLVIILDNLHHIPALGEVFSGLLNVSASVNLPCIIGTMSQATTNTSNLQLHYNFRWVLTANHMEPVKGFLGRYLKRRLHQLELQTHSPQIQMEKVFKWLPTVWQHINSFLETHSSSDVTIGPQLFLSCPLDVNESQSWFADLWNYHLIPYLVETIREGVQLYGKRGATWQDPCSFIRETYPWKIGPNSVPSLRQINAEEIGFKDGIAGSNDNQDPLLNMLMRLQEAASYNDNPEDSDGSLDSQLTHDTHDS